MATMNRMITQLEHLIKIKLNVIKPMKKSDEKVEEENLSQRLSQNMLNDDIDQERIDAVEKMLEAINKKDAYKRNFDAPSFSLGLNLTQDDDADDNFEPTTTAKQNNPVDGVNKDDHTKTLPQVENEMSEPDLMGETTCDQTDVSDTGLDVLIGKIVADTTKV